MKWEYKYMYAKHIYADQLNELGQDRWELVCVFDGYAYFKRPLIERKDQYITVEYGCDAKEKITK